jgi:hypothetical protein
MSKVKDGDWSDKSEEYWRKMGMLPRTVVDEVEALAGFPLKHLSSVQGMHIIYDRGLLDEMTKVADQLAKEEWIRNYNKNMAKKEMQEGETWYNYMGRTMSKEDWAEQGIDIEKVDYQAQIYFAGGHKHVTSKGANEFAKKLFNTPNPIWAAEKETIVANFRVSLLGDKVVGVKEIKEEPKPYKFGKAYYTANQLREQGFGEAVDQIEKKVKGFLDQPHKQLEKYRVVQTIIQNFNMQHESSMLEYVFECLKWPNSEVDYKQWKDSIDDDLKMKSSYTINKNEFYVQQKGSGPQLPDFDMEVRKYEVQFRFNGAVVKFTYPEPEVDYVEKALHGFKTMVEGWRIK